MQGGELSGCGSGVYIGDKASFRLEGGSIIDNVGRGVVALGPVTMNGGRVAGNHDGGFELYDRFEMNGGAISDNRGKNGVGLLAFGATVDLNGGSISGNRGMIGNAASFGGGAGVFARDSEVTLLSGSITGNAVYGSDPIFDNKGGGIYAERTPVNLLGGSISGNSAKLGGAGVALDGLSIELPLEQRITGNTCNGREANYWLLNGGCVHVTRPLAADEALDLGASLGGAFVAVNVVDQEVNSVIGETAEITAAGETASIAGKALWDTVGSWIWGGIKGASGWLYENGLKYKKRWFGGEDAADKRVNKVLDCFDMKRDASGNLSITADKAPPDRQIPEPHRRDHPGQRLRHQVRHRRGRGHRHQCCADGEHRPHRHRQHHRVKAGARGGNGPRAPAIASRTVVQNASSFILIST